MGIEKQHAILAMHLSMAQDMWCHYNLVVFFVLDAPCPMVFAVRSICVFPLALTTVQPHTYTLIVVRKSQEYK